MNLLPQRTDKLFIKEMYGVQFLTIHEALRLKRRDSREEGRYNEALAALESVNDTNPPPSEGVNLYEERFKVSMTKGQWKSVKEALRFFVKDPVEEHTGKVVRKEFGDLTHFVSGFDGRIEDHGASLVRIALVENPSPHDPRTNIGVANAPHILANFHNPIESRHVIIPAEETPGELQTDPQLALS